MTGRDRDGALSPHNLAYLEAMLEQHESEPGSIDASWDSVLHATASHQRATPLGSDAEHTVLQNRVDRLIASYRQHGHLAADTDPLGRPRAIAKDVLDPAQLGLGDAHLERSFNPGMLFDQESVSLRAILARLERTYCRHVGVEYWHLPDLEQRTWLQTHMESRENEVIPTSTEQQRLWRNLARIENVDRFLHAKFVGAKRFSLSGGESVIALLETMIEEAGELGVEEVQIGMAHRGRLNVLMNILGRTPADIFSEFESGDPWDSLGCGDVKYHKGAYRFHTTSTGKNMYLSVAFNPSHLEAITPVVSGRVRASQDLLGDAEHRRVLGVTIHGDAAIAGQGVFAETLNLAHLPAYSTGGTIRIVINNRVGFTTSPEESRSAVYCTAPADMLGVPIFHVNGDDPEAAAYVARLAIDFRQRYRRDVIIDLICYRKYGHNEGDEPTFTQPRMYEIIAKHPSVRSRYQELLLERTTVTPEECQALDRELHDEFEGALAHVRESGPRKGFSPMHGVWEGYVGGPEAYAPDVDTSITQDTVLALRGVLVRVPDGFNLHRKLLRLIRQYEDMLAGKEPLSWAAAENLAYGSLLASGHDIRMSGQDSIRGTFNHRHAAWVDTQTEERYFPLKHISADQGRFEIYNSPLSEYAVVGFEFGYSLGAPQMLVVWEAQFGDFCNGAQVLIDQFISSSEDKWNRLSGLVLLLPHGFEGQGPEHSSARLERFLQLCAEDNMQVCYPTESSQIFHLLRRQVLRPWRKPLIVMTPKSLLRTRSSYSPLEDFTTHSFRRVIDDSRGSVAKSATRILLCSGKVYYDLAEHRDEQGREDVAIIRVEQLYPFPTDELEQLLASYPQARELVWVQEEPRNMGAWFFVRPRLEEVTDGRLVPSYVGRPESASPATGSPDSHQLEVELILADAFD